MTAWLPSVNRKLFSARFLSRAISFFACPRGRWRKTSAIFLFAFVSFLPFAFSNNASVSNVDLLDRDASADTTKIEFDISWNNAWRDSVNYDAVWVFFKYSTDAGVTWAHATLKTAGTNPSGFADGTPSSSAFNALDIVVPTDKKGMFMQPAHQASGTVNFTNAQAVWDYGADAVTDGQAINANTRVRVFAIEMTYIATAGFYANDGNVNTTYAGLAAYNNYYPAVQSNEKIRFSAVLGENWYYTTAGNSGELATGSYIDVLGTWPKGYEAFYLMKYEITEGQYVGFLNTLTRDQQNKRVASDVTGDAPASDYTYVLSAAASVTNRNTVQCPASGNGTTDPITFTTDRSDRASAYLTWMDLAAYLDWSALRPMTELEFQKAARGPIGPVTNEFAWGTTSATSCATISGSEDGTETCSTSNANNVSNNTTFSGGDASTGPGRVGIFAKSSTVTRATTGAGYYGNMELSGNVWERTVTLGNLGGIGFSGTHGDGVLTTLSSYEANATNSDWPGLDSTPSRGVTGATGSGFMGGSWDETTAAFFYASSRTFAAYADAARQPDWGGRGARTAES